MASGGSGVPPDVASETHMTRTSPTDRSDPQAGKDTLKAEGESAKHYKDGAKVCQFFRIGKCHFGLKCRLAHSHPSLGHSRARCSDVDDKQDGEKTEKHKNNKGSVNKVPKSKWDEGREVSKKPRMRTADDVISRILWDPSVDASEFVVGYVDRFLGVLERPFCDFNWETNPCDCDYTTELALPKHRIQYFTYRGLRVWDRHTRTDRVFGSTGQSLAPPFGGEEVVKEENTEVLETTAEQPPAGSGQEEGCTRTGNTHLEKDKQNQMNIHTPESAPPAPECKGNTSQEKQESQGSCVVEEAADRHQDSADQSSSTQEKEEVGVKEEDEEETLAEWEESWEGNEDSVSYLAAEEVSKNPSAPLEQRKEKDGGRPPKKKPTHFITFRANTPAILSCFQQLQNELTSLLPSSAPHWQTASSLHVTLCLLVLHSPAEVAAAGEILQRFAQLDRNPPVAVTFPVKLKHFHGKVLYLSPQPQLQLQQLNSGLQEAYRKEGWLHRDSYNPRYHLTLAKLGDSEEERIFEGVGDLRVGKGLNFGRLPINTLHLCAIGGDKVDGFYESVCTVTLR